ncbi:MAG: DUF3604 domain-containing protein [Rhabdochlamydiaceae bacterium]|jgi:hypothetical protein
MVSKGRPIDWEVPKIQGKDKTNLIWAELPNGKAVLPKIVEKTEAFAPVFEFILPSEIKSGESFTIFLGSSLNGKEGGNRAQTIVQRRKPFYLHIDPRGKNDFREQETFHIDIKGNTLHNIRIITPSIVEKNKRFDVIVRFEDAYGNLTNNALENTLIELSYENLRENLNWKLFVPETGFINLPNLYFNEPGVYKIKLRNMKSEEVFYSAPIKCLVETPVTLFWGLLHGESEKFDSTENIESSLRFFRDEKALQFFATSPFESIEETSNEAWKMIGQQITEFNEDQRFNTFLGFQFFSKGTDEGLRQLVYFKENKPILRKKDAKTHTLKKLYQTTSPKDLLSIPCFTMGKGFETDFTNFQPDFERVVEIYNAWGSSECTEKEGNPRPISSSSKTGVQAIDSGSIVKALRNNCRFGFVAGGLDDRGIYEPFYEEHQKQYSPGLTAILATAQTREALMLALQNRSCYATTGERIIIGFNIAGAPMGSELSTKAKPGLAINRHISGYVAGTAPLKEVMIFRNGLPFKSLEVNSYFFDFAVDDLENISKITLPSADNKPPFIFYYLRVTQADGHMAWCSPIWVDDSEGSSASMVGKKTKKNENHFRIPISS